MTQQDIHQINGVIVENYEALCMRIALNSKPFIETKDASAMCKIVQVLDGYRVYMMAGEGDDLPYQIMCSAPEGEYVRTLGEALDLMTQFWRNEYSIHS